MKNHQAYTIALPQPCSEDWHRMTDTERGKFCMSCQKEVIDFSRMTDDELFRFIAHNKQPVCGRFRNTQLGRTITASQRKLRLFNVKKIAASIIAFISFKTAHAQQRNPCSPVETTM